MRIKCKPEEATYATVWKVEFTKVSDMWNWCGRRLYTKELEELNATFERDLPPVPDGKEYEYKEGDGSGAPFPDGSRYFYKSEGQWSEPCVKLGNHLGYIYAIPIKKESCVVERDVRYLPGTGHFIPTDMKCGTEVLIIPKDRVISDSRSDPNLLEQSRFIVVREDK